MCGEGVGDADGGGVRWFSASALIGEGRVRACACAREREPLNLTLTSTLTLIRTHKHGHTHANTNTNTNTSTTQSEHTPKRSVAQCHSHSPLRLTLIYPTLTHSH